MDLHNILLAFEAYFAVYGYLFVFLGVLIETTPFGWLVPGGLLAAMGGFYSYDGPLRLSIVILLGFCGMFLTLLSAYLIGEKTGMRLAKFLGQDKNAKHAKTLLENHGPTILTTALLANVTRFWVAYIAGAQKYNVFQFMLYAAIASFAWVSLLVMAGYLAGTGRYSMERNLAQVSIISWILLFITGSLIAWKLKKQIKKGQEDLETEEK